MHCHTTGPESPEVLSRASSTKLALKSTGSIFDRATQAWKKYDPQNAVGTSRDGTDRLVILFTSSGSVVDDSFGIWT